MNDESRELRLLESAVKKGNWRQLQPLIRKDNRNNLGERKSYQALLNMRLPFDELFNYIDYPSKLLLPLTYNYIDNPNEDDNLFLFEALIKRLRHNREEQVDEEEDKYELFSGWRDIKKLLDYSIEKEQYERALLILKIASEISLDFFNDYIDFFNDYIESLDEDILKN